MTDGQGNSRARGASRLPALATPPPAVLRRLEEAGRLLAEAQTIPEAKDVRDRAAAIRGWLASRGHSLDAFLRAAELKLRAERKLGEMLNGAAKHPGTRGQLAGRDASGGRVRRPPESTPPTLDDLGISRDHSATWQRVAGLPEERFKRYLAEARANEEEVTTATALRLAQGIAFTRTVRARPESLEWYTPAVYVEAAREVLGGIDLDPASSPEANRTVGAARFYTVEEDGLAQPWSGRVWMNPPYSMPGPLFVERLLEEHRAGRVPAAVVLLSVHALETRWFQGLWDHTLCFTDHRIAFVRPGGLPSAGSTFGNVFAYLGPEPRRFARVFSRFGAVMRRWPAAEEGS